MGTAEMARGTPALWGLRVAMLVFVSAEGGDGDDAVKAVAPGKRDAHHVPASKAGSKGADHTAKVAPEVDEDWSKVFDVGPSTPHEHHAKKARATKRGPKAGGRSLLTVKAAKQAAKKAEGSSAPADAKAKDGASKDPEAAAKLNVEAASKAIAAAKAQAKKLVDESKAKMTTAQTQL